MDKETKKSLVQVANISSMGIALGLTIFGCFFIGLYLDRKMGTAHLFTFLFLALGIAAGFKNIYGLIKKSLGNEKPLARPVDKPTDKKDDGQGENAAAKKD